MSKAALIVGAGDATGGAISKAFAREGYVACVNRRARNADQLEALAQSIRNEGYKAHAYPADARIEDDVVVAADGCLNLSERIPRHPDAIEEWIKTLQQSR